MHTFSVHFPHSESLYCKTSTITEGNTLAPVPASYGETESPLTYFHCWMLNHQDSFPYIQWGVICGEYEKVCPYLTYFVC